MKTWPLLTVSLSAALISACQSAPASNTPPPTPSETSKPNTTGIAPSLSDVEIFRADEDGTLTHLQSGVVCPETWGSFTRSQTAVYADDGTDIGCNYTSEYGAVVTLYAYQRSYSIEVEFKDLIDTIDIRNPGAQPAEIPKHLSSSDFPVLVYALRYKAVNGEQIKTGALLGERSGWRLKARLTYPEATASKVEQFAYLALRGWADRTGLMGQPLDDSLAGQVAP